MAISGLLFAALQNESQKLVAEAFTARPATAAASACAGSLIAFGRVSALDALCITPLHHHSGAV